MNLYVGRAGGAGGAGGGAASSSQLLRLRVYDKNVLLSDADLGAAAVAVAAFDAPGGVEKEVDLELKGKV